MSFSGEFADELEYEFGRKGSLPPAIQIMIALRFYASGSFQEIIGDIFGVSKATVCRVVHRVSAAIAATMNHHVKFDQQAGANVTKAKFFAMSMFPGIIGCIDCTHVKIMSPSEYENVYVNRKGYHSMCSSYVTPT